MTWRVRSVRKRILLLALVPLLSLFGLYVFTTSVTARNAINLARANTLKDATGQPTGNFERAIQTELLFVTAAGEGSCLAALTAVTADVGLVAFEMAVLVKRLGPHLLVDPRPSDR